MKNLKTLFFAIALVAFVVNTTSAQQKTKKNVKANEMVVDDSQDAKAQEMFRKAKAKATTDEQRAMIESKRAAYEQSKSNNGNAYGKNKGELEGKEFGQERAMSKKQLYKAYSETRAAEQTIEESVVKIKMAREKLEAAEKTQSLSTEEISAKKAKIDAAELELKDARQALENQRKLINDKHTELDSGN